MIAFAATFGSDLTIILLGKVLRLQFADCSAIAVEIVTKLPVLTFFLYAVLSEERGDFYDLFYDTTGLSVPVVLLCHFLWKYIGLVYVIYHLKIAYSKQMCPFSDRGLQPRFPYLNNVNDMLKAKPIHQTISHWTHSFDHALIKITPKFV